MSKIRNSLALFALTFSLTASAAVTFTDKTDTAKLVKKQDLGVSETAPTSKDHVQATCEAYPEFVLVSVTDPGMVGTGYLILPRKKGSEPKDLCGELKKPKDFTYWGGTLEGVLESLIVFSGEEPLGNLDHLTFFDAKKKRIVFQDGFNNGATVSITKVKNKIGVTYESFLEYPKKRCNPVVDEKGACLKGILKKNHIAADKIDKVDCANATLQNANDAKEGSVHLFIETQVKDIRSAQKKITGKTVTCTLSP